MYWLESAVNIIYGGIVIGVCVVLAGFFASVFSDKDKNNNTHMLVSILFFIFFLFIVKYEVNPKFSAWQASKRLEFEVAFDPIFSAIKKYKPSTYI